MIFLVSSLPYAHHYERLRLLLSFFQKGIICRLVIAPILRLTSPTVIDVRWSRLSFRLLFFFSFEELHQTCVVKQKFSPLFCCPIYHSIRSHILRDQPL